MTVKNKKREFYYFLLSKYQETGGRKKFKFDLEGGLFEIEKRSTSV